MDLRTTHQDGRIGVDLRGFGCGEAEVFSGRGRGQRSSATEHRESEEHAQKEAVRTLPRGKGADSLHRRGNASFGEEAQRRGISSLRSSAHRGRAYLPQLPPGYG